MHLIPTGATFRCLNKQLFGVQLPSGLSLDLKAKVSVAVAAPKKKATALRQPGPTFFKSPTLHCDCQLAGGLVPRLIPGAVRHFCLADGKVSKLHEKDTCTLIQIRL